MSVVSRRPVLLLPALSCALVLSSCGASADEKGTDPSGPPPAAAEYVALGDSFTSAPGVPETVDEGCFRSDGNYPSLVADALDLTLDDVSCGGATTTSLVGVQETPTGPVPPQFLALSEDTEVVTLSMGFNDGGLYGELMTACLQLDGEPPEGSPCRETMNEAGSDRLLETIDLIQTRLTSALTGIKDRAPNARVVLVGYPQLAPARVRCAALPLAAGDYDYMREIMIALGRATERAADEADADYIDVLAASEGHDICAGDEAWVSGVMPDPDRPAEPVHPFAEEQEAIAELVVAALDE